MAGGGSGGTTPTGGSGGTAGSVTGGTAGSVTGGTAGVATGGAGAGGTAGGGGAGQGGAGSGGVAGGGAGSGGMTGGMSGAGGRGGMAGGGAGGGGAGGGSGGGGAFTLTSPALTAMAGCGTGAMAAMCDIFPNENIQYMSNMNISPELNWTGVPAGTMSFAVLLQDLTNGMAHWVLWNIPGNATMLAANVDKTDASPPVPAGSMQSSIGTGEGYFGPGSACNVYEFVVYALSVPSFMPNMAGNPGNVRTQLQALGAQILGQASLRGRSNYMMMCASI